MIKISASSFTASLRSSRFLSFSRRRDRTSEQRSAHRENKNWREGGGGGEQRNPSLASPPPLLLIFLHSPTASFPLRGLLETPARQAILRPKRDVWLCSPRNQAAVINKKCKEFFLRFYASQKTVNIFGTRSTRHP